MFSTTKSIISFLIVLTFLLLASNQSVFSISGRICILISFARYFRLYLTCMTSSFLPCLTLPTIISSLGTGTDFSSASAAVKPALSFITNIFFYILSHMLITVFGTIVHMALFVLSRPILSRPRIPGCCVCGMIREPEAAAVMKVEHTRSQNKDTASHDALAIAIDLDDSPSSASSTCVDETDASSATVSLAYVDKTDAGPTLTPEFSFSDDSDPDAYLSIWDSESDATSATILSDSDISRIAARFNHALAVKRFCAADSTSCSPKTDCKDKLTTETDTGSDSEDSSSRLGNDSSSASISPHSTPQTLASNRLERVFSTPFTEIDTTVSRPAPTSRRESFSSNAPLLRTNHLFVSSTPADVSLAANSPVPSPPRGHLRLPGNRISEPYDSPFLDVFDAPGPRVVLPFPASLSTSSSALSVSPSSCSLADVLVHAPFIPASLSAWDLAEGWEATDDASRRIFGIPVEDLSKYSYSASCSSSEFSEDEEAYLCAALDLYESSSSEPRQGWWYAPWGPQRWHPTLADLDRWVFPGREGRIPKFFFQEVPDQEPYDEKELEHLWRTLDFSPTYI